MLKWSIGEQCYFVEGLRIIEGEIINQYASDLYTVKYYKGSNSCGIRLKGKRLYKSRQDAENAISDLYKQQRRSNPYDYLH